MKNDEQLKKMLAEMTPKMLVNAVDELLLLQRGKELGCTSATSSSRGGRQHPQGAGPPGRGEVPGRARRRRA